MLPPGYTAKGYTRVCKLLKSLYGLRQASRQWNLKLTEALLGACFTANPYDCSVFTKVSGQSLVIILIYVDDLLITGNDPTLIQSAKDILHVSFKIKDLGDLHYFVGIEFAHSNDGILMTQRKYALELIVEAGLRTAQLVHMPFDSSHKLTTTEYDKVITPDLNSDPLLLDPSTYQHLVEKLLYLAMTRVDISFAVQHLSQFMHWPKQSHMTAALRVIRYVKL